ncbi:hypothetical protein B0H65DRAFT_258288 [Neurospora tetraspora]|uniref:Leucine rich repeat domain-containing protein n=1 Tax=Neurospora tetraspora TaxID=94610 RepID=A0AAE0JAL2_9PEZI|nr:hypothetical protein B0H65DRAFT_258288 [Neurospora tetraspora]
MLKMDSEDGEFFIKQLASFVRTHEKALANALQFRRQNTPRHASSQSVSVLSTSAPTASSLPERPSTSSSPSSTLAAALSLGSLNFTSHNVKSAKLALTAHHLFYLLSRFEELAIPVGPMKVRLENLHDNRNSGNYVSFLSQTQRSKSRGSDVGSIHSVSSIRSVMSGMSALWSSFGIGSSISAARSEKQKAAIQADLKYLYSAFTKIPCLRLAPDFRARLIKGYEEFPFDSAVPLYVFKNVQALEVSDTDFRQFFGWDRLAEQLRSLTLKRASLDDPADVLIDIVLDDMDKRRRRSSKAQSSLTGPWSAPSPRRSPTIPQAAQKSNSPPSSPDARTSNTEIPVGSLNSESGPDQLGAALHNHRRPSVVRVDSDESRTPAKDGRPRSHSPRRPTSSRNGSSNVRGNHKIRRSGSGSSHSSLSDSWYNSRGSSSNLLAMGTLPPSKWRFLKHLSLADNSLASIPAASLGPLANTLHSLDLSANLFTQIPDSLATLTALRALNLAHCMIDSLHSLIRCPLPAITALNLRANRLTSIVGIEKLYPLERLDLRDNQIADPMELARLTGIPELREIYVEGNPFTRTHRDYRITIFNLFRQTPGYTEDITIDGSGPSYSERRYLVERAAEPPAVPVIKPAPQELPAVDVSKPAFVYEPPPREPAVLRKERPMPKSASSELNTASTRRRKAPKRRIVDLATNETPAPVTLVDNRNRPGDRAASGHNEHYRISQPTEVHAPQETLAASPLPDARAPADIPRIESTVIPSIPPLYPSHKGSSESQSWRDNDNWDIDGELYRRKIESLRDKVGSRYLSALNEEGWDHTSLPPNYREGNFGAPSPLLADPTAPRAASVQAIHSGRTLG